MNGVPIPRHVPAGARPPAGAPPLTGVQTGIWRAHQLDPGRPAYSIAWSVELHGRVDLDRLAAAVRRATGETGPLHVRVGTRGGTPRQAVALPRTPDLGVARFDPGREHRGLRQRRRGGLVRAQVRAGVHRPTGRRTIGSTGLLGSAGGAVGISAVGDVDDRNRALLIVDAVDDPVGAPSGAVTVIERRVKSLADSVRIVEQRTDDELVRREGRRLRQVLSELTSSGGSDHQRVAALSAKIT